MNLIAQKPRSEQLPGLWDADRFLDFCMTRPEGERWQLLDGLAMMMTPPSVRHQKIGKRLLRLLDAALDANRPDLLCLYETGLRIPGIDDFNPMPDLIVMRADDDFDRYVDRFFLVAEVISPSNSAELIDRKLELYRGHPDNLYCLTIDQDSVHVTLYAKETGWTKQDFRSLSDTVELRAFGFRATLAEIYAGTPLAR